MRDRFLVASLCLGLWSTFMTNLSLAEEKNPVEEFFADWVFAVCNSDHLERITHTVLLSEAYGANYGPAQLYAPELTIIERCNLKSGTGAVSTSAKKGAEYYARQNRGVLYWCHKKNGLQELKYDQKGVWWPIRATHSLIVHYAKDKIQGSLRLFICKEGDDFRLARPLPSNKKAAYWPRWEKYKKGVEKANQELFLYAEQGKWPLLAQRLKSGTNGHIRRADGVGLLMMAAKKGATEFVVQLLRLGFRAGRRDSYGYSAIDYARFSKVKGLAHLLHSSAQELTVILMKDAKGKKLVHLRGRSAKYPLYIFGGKKKSLIAQVGPKHLDKVPKGVPAQGIYPKSFTDEFEAPKDLTYLGSGPPELWVSTTKEAPEFPAFIFRFADFSQEAYWKKKFPKASDAQISAHLVNSANTWRKFNELAIGMANAIGNGNLQAVQQGFQLGININEPIANGFITPLAAAANEGKTKIVDLLLQSHANPHQMVYAGTPLCLAAAKGHETVVEALVKLGVDLNEPRGVSQCTALHAALLAKKPKASLLKLLLDKGANPNRLAMDGNFPPLVVAAAKGQQEAVRLLMKYGANVGGHNKMGITPLVAATFMGHLPVVKMLLAGGANVNEDQFGYLPSKLAKLRKHKEIEKFLISKGAKKVDKVGYLNEFWLKKLVAMALMGN